MVIGCAGRAANPVTVYQYGDEQRSCDALERELELIETELLDLLPQTEKTDKNTKLGVTGIFLLVPFLFMDISKSEQVEANALIKRDNRGSTVHGYREPCVAGSATPPPSNEPASFLLRRRWLFLWKRE
jgi:hypothetical protein